MRALDIVDKAGLSSTQLFASRAYLGVAESALLAGDVARARQFARRALETSAARGEVNQMVAALQLLAGALRQSNDRAGAARTLEVAVQLIEQVPIDELDGEKRATYLATQHAVYSELTELLITDAQDESAVWNAFRASERGRARSLRFATSLAEHSSIERAAVETSERYAELMRKVAAPAVADGANVELPDYVERLAQSGGYRPAAHRAVDRIESLAGPACSPRRVARRIRRRRRDDVRIRRERGPAAGRPPG